MISVNLAYCIEYCTEYESQWKKELIANDLEHVFNAFYDNHLFSTPFLLYLNDDGINKILEELGIILSESDRFKINTIAWKIHYQQQQIDHVGLHYNDQHGQNSESESKSSYQSANHNEPLAITVAALRNPII